MQNEKTLLIHCFALVSKHVSIFWGTSVAFMLGKQVTASAPREGIDSQAESATVELAMPVGKTCYVSENPSQ